MGIDHGYRNIKTANTVTPTGITKLDAAPTFTKHALHYDGSYYLISEGCGCPEAPNKATAETARNICPISGRTILGIFTEEIYNSLKKAEE